MSKKFTKDQRRLVRDICEIFRSKSKDRMRAVKVLKLLNIDPEKQWSTFCEGKKLTSKRLYALLKDFGIVSQTVRFSSKTFKGFYRNDFRKAKRLIVA